MYQRVCTLIAVFLCAAVFGLGKHSVAADGALSRFSLGDLHFEGMAVQGGFLRGKAPVGTQIVFDGYPVRVDDNGRFILGFHRDDPNEMILRAVFPNEKFVSHNLDVRKRRYRIERINGLDPKRVTPPPSVFERISQEANQARAARRFDSAIEFAFDRNWVWPVKGRITGVFGSARILNGEQRRPHFGIDIAAPAGSNVQAPAGGVVRLVHPDMYYSGGTVILDHGHGLFSTFLHLQNIAVAPDMVVQKGESIGTVGATGRATGAHLDWRVNWFDKRLDARLFLPANNR